MTGMSKQNEIVTKLMTLNQYEFRLYERKNGKKFIKIITYINDAEGYVEVARINPIKSSWNNDGEFSMDEVYATLNDFYKCSEGIRQLGLNKELKFV